MSERKKREQENFPLPKGYSFLFYFVIDGKFSNIDPESKYWPQDYSTLDKLNLEKGDEVAFNNFPQGIFVWKGPAKQLKLVEMYLDNEIEKGALDISNLEVTNALQEALKKIEIENLEYMASQELLSESDSEENLGPDRNDASEFNYNSSPEHRVSASQNVTKIINPGTQICPTCNQNVDRKKQVS